jgi:hypothetical protein
MARSGRRRVRRLVMWTTVAVLFGGMTFGVDATVAADAASPVNPHVRSSNAAIRAAMDFGQLRSATFRSLVSKIEETDGIVYVERGRCGHGVPACLTLSVISGGGYRLLRILVGNVDDLMSLVATLGHELRHALELLAEPAVRTMGAAYNFYMREGPTTSGVFETQAAIHAGLQVERELKVSN